MNQNNKNSPRASDEKSNAEMREAEVDENLEESFSASDPPSWTLGSDHSAATEAKKAVEDERRKD